MATGNTPPPPRPTHRLCGIYNQGATCYLNSLLQTLAFTPEFRESLFRLGACELGQLVDKDRPEIKARVIPLHLQRLFARLLLLDVNAVKTDELTGSFGWNNNEERDQHDVQELNRILFSAIEDSLVATAGESVIRNLYHGTIVNQIKCEECGGTSEREEDFLDLSLAVSGFTGLEDSLQAAFIEKELLIDANKYNCSRCARLTNAHKGARLRHLPPLLTVSLLRFNFDFVKMERFKEISKFTFPIELNMQPYCDSIDSGTSTEYELYSVVIHRGSTHGGHYHAYIRDVDNLGIWTTPAEEKICLPANAMTGRIEIINCESPAELIRAILERKTGGPGMNVSALCEEMVKQTGVSWGKRFKKQHGSITQFLKRNEKIFDYNPASEWISLRSSFHLANENTNSSKLANGECRTDHCENNSSSDAAVETNGHDCVGSDTANASSCSNTSPRETTLPAVINECGDSKLVDQVQGLAINRDFSVCNGTVENSNEAAVPPVVHRHWFDFDDAHVHPMPEADIETQYAGKESAYMLFYRSKSLVRPAEAASNPQFNIPESFILDITNENSQLHQLRELYDSEVNATKVEVHFGCRYNYCDGALQPRRNDGRTSAEITVNKRHPVSNILGLVLEKVLGHNHLRTIEIHPRRDYRDRPTHDISKDAPDIIFSNYSWTNSAFGDDIAGDDVVIHLAKELPAGLHLYDNITADLSSNLAMYGVDKSCHLFFWNGRQVNGQSLYIGAGCEPILLTLSLFGSVPTQQFSCGYAKNLCLAELKRASCERFGLNPDTTQLRRMADNTCVTSSDKQVNCYMPLDDDSKTIKELNLCNCDQLICVDLTADLPDIEQAAEQLIRSADPSSNKLSNRLVLNIENRCLDTTPFCRTSVEIEPDLTVQELKMIVLTQADVNQDQITRLRIDGHGAVCAPLHEHENVASVGLRDGMSLILEPGLPPSNNQVTLFISVMEMEKLKSSHELTVDIDLNVSDLLRLATEKAGLDGLDWHLRRTDLFGERKEMLDDLQLTIEGSNLKHGDTVLLLPGQLPPKGSVSLSIYLNGSLEASQPAGIIEGITSSIKDGANAVFGGSPIPSPVLPGSHLSISSSSCTTLIGTLVVSKQLTLADLKQQVINLDPLLSFNIPSPRCLRLRLLENHRPSSVLRVHAHSIQKLKLSSGTSICVEILNEEEDLGSDILRMLTEAVYNGASVMAVIHLMKFVRMFDAALGRPQECSHCDLFRSCRPSLATDNLTNLASVNQLLLIIAQRLDDERRYVAPMEVVWDISQGASLGSLRKVVSSLTMSSGDKTMLLAKRIVDKHSWLLLKDGDDNGKSTKQPQQQKKNKKKKGGGGGGNNGANKQSKVDLRHAPFNLKDGDIIGVKIWSEGCDGQKEDFSTASDDEVNEKLASEKEQAKLRRLERRNGVSGESNIDGVLIRSKRPENAIKIHVDNFR